MVVLENKEDYDLVTSLTDDQNAKVDQYYNKYMDSVPEIDDKELVKDYEDVAKSLKENPEVLKSMKTRWLPAFQKKLKELQAAKKYIKRAFFEVYDKIGSLTEFEGHKEWQEKWSVLQKEYEKRLNASRDLAVKITSMLSTVTTQLEKRYKEDGFLDHFIQVATEERAAIDVEKARFDELKTKLLDFKIAFDLWTDQTTDDMAEVVQSINDNIGVITNDLQKLEMHKQNLLKALMGIGIATPALALVLGLLTCGVGALIVGLVGAVSFAAVGFAIIGIGATIQKKTSELQKLQGERDKLTKQLTNMKALETDVDKFVREHISGDGTDANPGIVAELDSFKSTWDSIASVLGEVKNHVESGNQSDWKWDSIDQVAEELGELTEMMDLFRFELELGDEPSPVLVETQPVMERVQELKLDPSTSEQSGSKEEIIPQTSPSIGEEEPFSKNCFGSHNFCDGGRIIFCSGCGHQIFKLTPPLPVLGEPGEEKDGSIPLIASGTVPLENISVSETYDGNWTVSQIPLNSARSWLVRNLREEHWCKVDLGCVRDVVGISTQGRPDADQHVRTLDVYGSGDGILWTKHDLRIHANSDSKSIVYHAFSTTLRARFIKIVPVEYHNSVTMRLEIHARAL